MTYSPKTVSLIFGVLVVTFLAVFYVIAWTGPTASPPDENTQPPCLADGTNCPLAWEECKGVCGGTNTPDCGDSEWTIIYSHAGTNCEGQNISGIKPKMGGIWTFKLLEDENGQVEERVYFNHDIVIAKVLCGINPLGGPNFTYYPSFCAICCK